MTGLMLRELDILEELPSCIIHLIMSLLEHDDMIRMRTVSKSWRDISLSYYPCLKFNDYKYTPMSKQAANLTKTEKGVLLRKVVSNTLQRFHERGRCITSFHLVMDLVDNCDFARLDAWIELLIMEFNVIEITLLLGWIKQDIHYTLPDILFTSNSLTKLKTRCCNFNYSDSMILGQSSLRSLKLCYGRIDEEAISDLQICCPYIESISITVHNGLSSTLDFGCLNRLKSLACRWYSSSVIIKPCNPKIMVEAPSLELLKLEEISCSVWDNDPQDSTLGNDVIVSLNSKSSLECLKRLELIGFSLKNEFVMNIVSRSSSCNLEYLSLYKCCTPQEMLISSPSLTTIHFGELSNLQKVDFDTPKLCSFTFRSTGIPNLVLADIGSIHRRDWCTELVLDVEKIIDDTWCAELATLVNTNQIQVLTLIIHHRTNGKLRLSRLSTADESPYELDKLQIEYRYGNKYQIAALLEALLCKFRPLHLSFN